MILFCLRHYLMAVVLNWVFHLDGAYITDPEYDPNGPGNFILV